MAELPIRSDPYHLTRYGSEIDLDPDLTDDFKNLDLLNYDLELVTI